MVSIKKADYMSKYLRYYNFFAFFACKWISVYFKALKVLYVPQVHCLELKYKYEYITFVLKSILSISTSTQEGVLKCP